MEIRLTHVDFVAIEMRGFLLDGAVNLEPESHPEILLPHSAIGGSSEALHQCIMNNMRVAAGGRGSFQHCPPPPPPVLIAPESLNPVPPKPLNRVAIEPNGNVDMKFYVCGGDIPLRVESTH